MMDFSRGNSGNILLEAVVKIGPEAQQEGSYCELLGEDVCPKIYAIIPNGYVMERLEPTSYNQLLLVSIENLLRDRVWNRPILPSSNDIDWRESLKKYGVETPSYIRTIKECMVHGDPTASNTLTRTTNRMDLSRNRLIICDPRPPRSYIPQWVETDMARIMQSYFGWEQVAYGIKPIKYIEPSFWSDLLLRKQISFWLGAAVARIEHLERSRPNPRRHLLDWCLETRNICNV